MGIVGAGRVAEDHARAVASVVGAPVSCVFDTDANSAREFAERFHVPKVAMGLSDLLRSVTALVVCTPTDSHADISVAALEMELSVLCEKPLAGSLLDLDRVLRSAGQGGRLSVALVRRYDREWLSIAEVIQSGELGRPIVWRQSSASAGPIDKPWYNQDGSGGGPLLDKVIHTVDFAIGVFGDVKTAFASGSRLRAGSSAFDTTAAIVEFRSGDRLEMSFSWGLPRGVRGVESFDVFGPSGALVWPGGRAQGKSDHFDVTTSASVRSVHFGVDSLPIAFEQNLEFLLRAAGPPSDEEASRLRMAHKVCFDLGTSAETGSAIHYDS